MQSSRPLTSTRGVLIWSDVFLYFNIYFLIYAGFCRRFESSLTIDEKVWVPDPKGWCPGYFKKYFKIHYICWHEPCKRYWNEV